MVTSQRAAIVERLGRVVSTVLLIVRRLGEVRA